MATHISKRIRFTKNDVENCLVVTEILAAITRGSFASASSLRELSLTQTLFSVISARSD